MTKEQISKQCLVKRELLIAKYCDMLPIDSPLSIEQIRERMIQMEEEYKLFLTGLWEKEKGADTCLLDTILDKQWNRVVLAKEYTLPIKTAMGKANEITLWEQITNSNYRDIEQLNALITAYARDLLAHITLDFMEDL